MRVCIIHILTPLWYLVSCEVRSIHFIFKLYRVVDTNLSKFLSEHQQPNYITCLDMLANKFTIRSLLKDFTKI